METLDPATGQPLPPDAIQRILFVSNSVHVYNIPPMPSNRGYVASTWTTDPSRHIFTARLRVVETSTDSDADALPTASLSPPPPPPSATAAANKIKIDVVLEDASTGQLFAAAPYTSPAIVDPVIDSSRFFAVTVRDPSGKKAVLGIGFEERSEAFDLGISLQEARKSLGWDSQGGAGGGGNQVGGNGSSKGSQDKHGEAAKDYSLKEGETITVNFGGSKMGRRRPAPQQQSQDSSGSRSEPVQDLQSFALAPPPGMAASETAGSGISPPQSTRDVKEKRKSARDLGFDDGQFGEFA